LAHDADLEEFAFFVVVTVKLVAAVAVTGAGHQAFARFERLEPAF
jgi:hypothetical protein